MSREDKLKKHVRGLVEDWIETRALERMYFKKFGEEYKDPRSFEDVVPRRLWDHIPADLRHAIPPRDESGRPMPEAS